MELEHFRSQYLKEWGRPLGASLAMRDQNHCENERNSWQYSVPGQRRHAVPPFQQQMRTDHGQEISGWGLVPQIHQKTMKNNFIQGAQRGAPQRNQGNVV
ncbi:hypothetical protein GcM3_094011 [Golovinomyces cichoracearum]|uniref:Uncharacterized protein n=1 Tax=Golovinomyces cichoracearum TaxID=62708 RepID=A0A420IFJ4_9PEZI|nr:hypothetical protein GcM3_094011 [Golovinomyces cichoracearum]